MTVRARQAADDRWRLEVADEGPGIAPATATASSSGSGPSAHSRAAAAAPASGLAIARWVTDLHGGTIGFVDPEPGDVRRPGPRRPPARRRDPLCATRRPP